MTENPPCQHEASKLRLFSIEEHRSNFGKEVTFQMTLKCVGCSERIYFGKTYQLTETITH